MNLTSIREPEEIVRRHFGESFFVAAQLIRGDWRGSVIDVGSGAGFPGLPMAIWAPDAQVTLIESHAKKAAFLNEAIFSLNLKSAKVFRGRAEACSISADMVTLRAVERFIEVLPSAERLVSSSGRLVLMVGSSQVTEARRIAHSLDWHDPVAVPGGSSRVLLTGTKSVNN